MFPLNEILDKLLKAGQKEMGRPVEIEFAVDITDQQLASFYVLQIRPIVDSKEVVHENLEETEETDAVLISRNALGNGKSNDVYDVIYVKTTAFNASKNPLIAREIEQLNSQFVAAGTNYVLIGPGRWENYRIEPSQGTHFFQNLTSFGVGYFTINPFLENDGWFDESFLNAQPAVHETAFIRHIHFGQPMCIKINGKKRIGVVLKPGL